MAPKKTKLDDSTRLLVEERAAVEREKSDVLYAIKLVERIVFAIVGAAGLAVLYALFKLVIVAQSASVAIPLIPKP